MASSKISIIIPTFNRAKSLPLAIESVLSQSNKNWELIIVDDGSRDNTKRIVQGYLNDFRIKYHFQENEGVSSARNSGVEISKGDYIIFLDSDDTFYPDLIQTLYDVNIFEYDIVCWQVQKIIDGKKVLWKAKKLGGMYNFLKITFFPGSICYKKQIFLNAGGFDPKIKFGENYELGIRVSEQKNLKIKLIKKTFLLYVIQSAKRESSSIQNRIPSHFHQLKKHINKYNLYPREKAELIYIIGYLLEKHNQSKRALTLYKMAFHNYPFRVKTIIKILFLSIFK